MWERHKNYTTTEFLDTTPDEKVREVQQRLNELGYTDKFGEKLKEDGVIGAKTRYAYDTYEAKNKNNTTMSADANYNIDYAMYYPERDTPRMLTNEELARKYGESDAQLIGFKEESNNSKKQSIEYPLSNNGKLAKEDSRNYYTETKKTLIRCISAIWFMNEGDEKGQTKIHNQAMRLRDFNDGKIEKAYLINNSKGASKMGHNAVMLVDDTGMGVIFSVFSTKGGINALLTHAELRFSALEKEKVDQFVNNNGKITDIFDMPATDGAIQDEKYDNLKMFEVSHEDGEKMFEFAVDRYDRPGLYLLTSENCDHFATDCLNLAENIDIYKARIKPNTTFEKA